MSSNTQTRDSERNQCSDTPVTFSEVRDIVLDRDRHRCTCCGKPQQIAESLDIDHSVPRGIGGSERLANLHTLCRQCHDAKHDNGVATAIQWQSTGMMDRYEFQWFRHLATEILPALARQADVRIKPKFNLQGANFWYLAVGDAYRLDRKLSQADPLYSTIDAFEE